MLTSYAQMQSVADSRRFAEKLSTMARPQGLECLRLTYCMSVCKHAEQDLSSWKEVRLVIPYVSAHLYAALVI
jgi:hypothetical protein